MIYLHFLMAVSAAWRITELFTQDRITDRLRKKLDTYLFSCPRCMSVWAGAWCSLVFALGLRWPWVAFLNWPFALAWFYLAQLDWAVGRRISQKGREFTVRLQPAPNGQGMQWSVARNELQPQELAEVLRMIVMPVGQPPAQPPVANGGA